MSRCLMIGAGKTRRDNWVRLDADPESGAEIISSVPPLPPQVRAESWDAIEMIHVIEHFYLWDARQLLREIWQVLAPGGTLIIEAPNILYAARVLCGLEEKPKGGQEGQFDMWAFYGSPVRRNPLYGHRWGYSPESMTAELHAAGFDPAHVITTEAKFHQPKRDFRVEATKPD